MQLRRDKMGLLRSLFITAFLVASQHTTVFAGVITWNVSFDDVSEVNGLGFDDALLGATRRQTFLDTLDYVGSVLNETGTVDLRVTESRNDGTGSLASAGPFFFTGTNGFYNGFVYDHVRNGIDPVITAPDAVVNFNFGYTWNSEVDTPSSTEYDLFTVALHEMTHALGFTSLVDSSGNSSISSGDPGVFSVFDSFLELSDGTSLFGDVGDFLGTAADLTSNDVVFTGTNASLAYGGPVPIYSPSTFATGSSIGHFADEVTSVMNYSVEIGTTRRTFSSVDLGVLADIGWNIQGAQNASVPEPSSAVVIGILGIFAVVRKRSYRRTQIDA